MPYEAPIILDRKLWLTEDKDRLVEHGDPDAAFLFGIAGRKISAAECRRLKYKPDGKIAADDETAQTVASDAAKSQAIKDAEAKVAEAEALLKGEEDKADDAAVAKAEADEKKRLADEAKKLKAAEAKAAKEAKKLKDKERKKGSNKGAKKGGK